MNGTSSKGILADFYQKNFKNKQEMKEENGVEDSESSSDEDFVCGSSPSDNSQSSSLNSSEEETENESDENSEVDNKQENGKTSSGFAPNENNNKINDTKCKKTLSKQHQDQAKNGKFKNHKEIEKDGNSLGKNSPKTSSDTSKNCKSNSNKVTKKHEYCCICLNEQSDNDELVACDSCGFFAHEGCYGIGDNDSAHESSCSVASSASTEPWFCNSCLYENAFEPKAMQKNDNKKFQVRECELCPNTECGLLKETNTGRFVHLICALYTPGVTFQNTDKLWPVVLSEISPNRWGERICSLCDNLRLARSGVCIECDAGLCKTFFHVTCAQKYGLLPDPNQQNSDDPFFASCRQHNEKPQITLRKAKYEAMVADYKSKKTDNTRLFENYPDRDRLSKKFKKAKTNYQISRKSFLKHSVDNKKVPRMLTTCPSALKMLLTKTSLNNYEIEKDEGEHYKSLLGDQQSHTSCSTVAFNIDFVKYYYDREKKIVQFKKELSQLKEAQLKLTQEEEELRSQYEKKLAQHKKCLEKNAQTKENYKTIGNIINLIQPQKKENPKSKKKAESKNNQNNMSQNKITNGAKNGRKLVKNDEIILLDLNLNSGCCICNKKNNSHLMVDCDTCKNIYHISCLDPPLPTLPKKTKLYGWECCKCVHKKNKDNSGDFDDTLSESSKHDVNLSKSIKRERKSTSRFIIDSVEVKQTKRKRNSSLKKAKKTKKQNSTKIKKEKCTSQSSTNEKMSISSNSKPSDAEECIYIDDDESEMINEKKSQSFTKLKQNNSSLSMDNKKKMPKKRNSIACSNDLNVSGSSSMGESIDKKRKLVVQTSSPETIRTVESLNQEVFSSNKNKSPRLSLPTSMKMNSKGLNKSDSSEKITKKTN